MRGKLTFDSRKRYDLRITPADAGKTALQGSELPSPQDHPRGCGENLFAAVSVSEQAGSPPRMRGKPFLQCKVFLQYRITPADAGKTALPTGRSLWRRDHPRGCGENLQNLPTLISTVGSPPRMRGKRGLDRRRDPSGRITPADAGKTVPAMQGISPI